MARDAYLYLSFVPQRWVLIQDRVYSGQGAYLYFEKQSNVQNKT